MKITLKFCYTLAKSKNQVDKDGQHWNQLNRKDLADNSTEKKICLPYFRHFSCNCDIQSNQTGSNIH